MADKQKTELERIYTIPLREVKTSPRNHRTDRAVRAVKKYLSKHMKSEEIWIDASVNEKLWARGMYQIPSKIRVRALKFDDGVVEVTLPEADVTSSQREALKKRREETAAEREKKTEKKDKPEGKTDDEAAKDESKKAEEKAGGEKKEGAEKKAAPAEKPDAQAKPEAGDKPKSAQKPAPKQDAGPKADAKSESQAKPQPKKE